MGLWVINEGWGPFKIRHWTYFPGRKGDDNVNLPPPAVASTAKRGPVYNCPADGHAYRTWIVQGYKEGVTNQIVDWREKLDVTGADPAAIEVTKGQ